MNMVIVIGSINLDWMIWVENMLKFGEMIYIKEIFLVGGGKGVN